MSKHRFESLRVRLIISVAVIHALLMSFFVADVLTRQNRLLKEEQQENTFVLTQTLATAAEGWVASNDIAGLEELILAQRNRTDLVFILFTDMDGRILAHTEMDRKLQYVVDMPKEPRETIISNTAELLDIAVPVKMGGKQVGWVRVGADLQ